MSGTFLQFPTPPSAERDAFQRFRVSQPAALFDSKSVFDNGEGVTWETAAVGAASATYQQQQSSTLMTAPAVGDSVIRQTRQYFNYQPGKSQLVLFTFNMLGFQGGTKRAGYFDAQDGVFLEVSNGEWAWVTRSFASGAAVDTRIPQSEWNLDKALDIDPTKVLLGIIDVEWLGVGSIRVGFVREGVITYTHQFNHDNLIATVWSRNPNLPIRYEVDGPGSMRQICASVASEGGADAFGITHGYSRITGTSVAAANPEQVLAIRLKDNYRRATVRPTRATVLSTTKSDAAWYVVLNPTFTGGAAPNWQDIDDSAVQYDITRNGVWNRDGIVLATGMMSNTSDIVDYNLMNFLTFGCSIDGTARDEIVLMVEPLAGTDTFYGSLNWLEVL